MTKQIEILNELKELLINNLGDIIDRVILFGSQVNGTAREYSDYDILVILKNDYDWKLRDKIIDLCYEIDLKYDILTDIKVISNSELQSLRGQQPFIINALAEGVRV